MNKLNNWHFDWLKKKYDEFRMNRQNKIPAASGHD
jgi:hypothetical protein